MFALSRTGFPLDNCLQPFVPDVSKKISYCVLDAFTGARESLRARSKRRPKYYSLSLLDKFLHAPLEWLFFR